MVRRALIIPVVLAAALCASLLPGPHYGAFGTSDFLEYWSAYRQYVAGLDPYDPWALSRIQAEVGSHRSSPIMMWNPPWLLTLLDPVLRLNFTAASRTWLALNIVFLVACLVLAFRLAKFEARPAALALAALAFLIPIWNSLYTGQIGLLLGLAALGLLAALRARSAIGAALCLVVFSVKLHLFLPLLVAVGWHCVRTRFVRPLLYAAAAFGAVVLVTELRSPGALDFYSASMGVQRTGSVHPLNWITPTLPGMLRYVIEQFGGGYPVWPLVVVPAATLCATLSWLVLSRPNLLDEETYALLILTSYVAAPFGWVFDMNIFLLLPVLAVRSGVRSRFGLAVLALLAAVQLLGALLTLPFNLQLHHFAWVPAAVYFAWFLCRNVQARTAPAAT